MIARQPLPQVRRQQKPLLTTTFDDVLRHPEMLVTRPDRPRLCGSLRPNRELGRAASCFRFAADGGSDARGAACSEVGTGWRPPRHRRPRRASRPGFSSTRWRRRSSLARDLPIANVRSSHPVAASAWEAFRAFAAARFGRIGRCSPAPSPRLSGPPDAHGLCPAAAPRRLTAFEGLHR
jgi:hypothetical protein